MKANHISLLTLLALLLPQFLLATVAFPAAAATFDKRLSETYSVNNSGRVSLDNRYGEIKVVTWTQQQVKIDVLIQVQARNQDDADDVFDRIDVRLSGGSNSASAVTSISSGGGGSFWSNFFSFGGSSSDDYKIYYTISMPAGAQLDVAAKYCDVELPSLSGRTSLEVGYGDLIAGKLTGTNEVSVSYGSARVDDLGPNSTVRMRYSEGSFRHAGDLNYDGRYSESRFGQVGALRLDVGYEEIDVESATEIRLSGNYNELAVERVERVYLDGNYTDFNLGTVTKVLEMDGNYGDIEVERLAADFVRVSIRASYADVDIDVEDNSGFTLDLSARYGDISVPTDGLTNREIRSEGSTESVKGTKSGSGTGTIRIETNYGDIEIY